MSTSNTEYLKLYKNTKLYNGSRYQFYLTNREQAFLAFLGEPFYEATVYYKSLSEPIELKKTFEELDGVTYGSITNEDKTYYFFVDNIRTDSYKKTFMEYTIDWWTTNWNNINPTKAHILRQNRRKPEYMEQPYTPLSTTAEFTALFSNFVIMATYIPSVGDSPSYICQIVLPGTDSNLRMVDQGYWYEMYGLAGADIKDCFIVPCFDYDEFGASGLYQPEIYVINVPESSFPLPDLIDQMEERYGGYTFPDGTYTFYNEATDKYYSVEVSGGAGVPSSITFIGTGREIAHTEYEEYVGRILNNVKYKYKRSAYNAQPSPMYKTISQSFTSTEKIKQGIADWNGNIIWECPYGVTVESFSLTLQFGISHIFVQFLPEGFSFEGNVPDLITGKGFTYDCRHPGLFVDSYQDYVLKNRDYDIQMRRLQSERQELQAWVSAAENVGFGAAFGQAQGAAAAGIGGIIEAFGTTILNNMFDPQIQRQYDRRYQRMTDQVSVIGDTVTPLYFRDTLYRYDLEMDIATQNRMDADIDTNGYYTDEITNNLKNWFANGRVIQADNVVVEGACNVIGKQQVVRRLMNGVEFI